jgi:hypothetical protein
MVHDPNTRILQCNSTACTLLGLSREQLLGKDAIDPTWHFLCEDGNPMPLAEYPVNRVLATRAPLKNYQLVAGFPAWVNLSESSCMSEFLSFLTKMAQAFLVEPSAGAKCLKHNSGNGFPHI